MRSTVSDEQWVRWRAIPVPRREGKLKSTAEFRLKTRKISDNIFLEKLLTVEIFRE